MADTYDDLSITQLRQRCTDSGLAKTGSEDQLKERLRHLATRQETRRRWRDVAASRPAQLQRWSLTHPTVTLCCQAVVFAVLHFVFWYCLIKLSALFISWCLRPRLDFENRIHMQWWLSVVELSAIWVVCFIHPTWFCGLTLPAGHPATTIEVAVIYAKLDHLKTLVARHIWHCQNLLRGDGFAEDFQRAEQRPTCHVGIIDSQTESVVSQSGSRSRRRESSVAQQDLAEDPPTSVSTGAERSDNGTFRRNQASPERRRSDPTEPIYAQEIVRRVNEGDDLGRYMFLDALSVPRDLAVAPDPSENGDEVRSGPTLGVSDIDSQPPVHEGDRSSSSAPSDLEGGIQDTASPVLGGASTRKVSAVGLSRSGLPSGSEGNDASIAPIVESRASTSSLASRNSGRSILSDAGQTSPSNIGQDEGLYPDLPHWNSPEEFYTGATSETTSAAERAPSTASENSRELYAPLPPAPNHLTPATTPNARAPAPLVHGLQVPIGTSPDQPENSIDNTDHERLCLDCEDENSTQTAEDTEGEDTVTSVIGTQGNAQGVGIVDTDVANSAPTQEMGENVSTTAIGDSRKLAARDVVEVTMTSAPGIGSEELNQTARNTFVSTRNQRSHSSLDTGMAEDGVAHRWTRSGARGLREHSRVRTLQLELNQERDRADDLEDRLSKLERETAGDQAKADVWKHAFRDAQGQQLAAQDYTGALQHMLDRSSVEKDQKEQELATLEIRYDGLEKSNFKLCEQNMKLAQQLQRKQQELDTNRQLAGVSPPASVPTQRCIEELCGIIKRLEKDILGKNEKERSLRQTIVELTRRIERHVEGSEKEAQEAGGEDDVVPARFHCGKKEDSKDQHVGDCSAGKLKGDQVCQPQP
ncbi:MAG: hypothetical protein Q9170_003142 [Blastenia crenularia]